MMHANEWTIDEAVGIASKEAHELSYKCANWIFDIVKTQKISIEVEGVKEEERMLEIEGRAIFEKMLEIGDGDPVVGIVKGYETGILDVPFSSNSNCKSTVLGIRDNEGACRYLDFGNLPLPEEIKEFINILDTPFIVQ